MNFFVFAPLKGTNLARSLLVAFSAVSYGQTPSTQQWLDGHNSIRRNLAASDQTRTASPDLTWSDALASGAQEWATRFANSGAPFEHRPNSANSTNADARPWGENLAWGSSQTYNPLDGLTQWVNERQFFNPVPSKCTGNNVCGHYTQVISQLSKEVGCASATGSNGTYIVCNYSPHGNLQENGAYAELYPRQRAPTPGGPVFAGLNANVAPLTLMFNQCLTDIATNLLSKPAGTGNPAPVSQPAACNFNTVRSYDTQVGFGMVNPTTGDDAGGRIFRAVFSGQILGTSGGIAVATNPLRAVVVTGE